MDEGYPARAGRNNFSVGIASGDQCHGARDPLFAIVAA